MGIFIMPYKTDTINLRGPVKEPILVQSNKLGEACCNMTYIVPKADLVDLALDVDESLLDNLPYEFYVGNQMVYSGITKLNQNMLPDGVFPGSVLTDHELSLKFYGVKASWLPELKCRITYMDPPASPPSGERSWPSQCTSNPQKPECSCVYRFMFGMGGLVGRCTCPGPVTDIQKELLDGDVLLYKVKAGKFTDVTSDEEMRRHKECLVNYTFDTRAYSGNERYIDLRKIFVGCDILRDICITSDNDILECNNNYIPKQAMCDAPIIIRTGGNVIRTVSATMVYTPYMALSASSNPNEFSPAHINLIPY
jgi:hypothetical protein